MTNFEQAQKIKEAELPPMEFNLKKSLFSHEEVAASFCALMHRCMNLDDMGVGKTMSSLGACYLLAKDSPQKVIILAPSTIQSQWRDAIDEFLGWSTIVISGSKDHRESQVEYFNNTQENICMVTNYSQPLKDTKTMLTMKPTVVIADEATFLKSPEAQIHKFFREFTENIENIFLLTGTPITLTLGDIYWLFSLLHIPDVLGTYEEEVLPYLEFIKKGRHLVEDRAKGFDALINKIEPYLIRRTLEEVLEDSDDMFAQFIHEPPKLEVHPLKYSNEQAEVFQSLKVEANRLTRQGAYKPLEMYQKFLQTCSSPKLIGLQAEPSPKELFLLDYLENTTDKIVVYVRYLEFLKCLQKALDCVIINYNLITGQLTPSEQELQKNLFLESDSRVLFITGAGKYGLNLQKANTFIFLDIPYNPADILQMIRRVYRYGQEGKVKVLLTFLEDTLEEDNFRKLYKRQGVLDEFFGTENAKVFQRDPNYTFGFLEKDYNPK